MSILGAMNTAVSGLAAQSAAFSNISDNIANSQTVGFKGVSTSFSDYLTTSSATVNDPGTVVAAPRYDNTVQGTITQSTNTLALAVSGQGFFDASKAINVSTTGQTTFANQQYYTRDGDFQLNASGYLTNDSGLYLNGWIANPTTGVLDKSNIQPIQVAQSIYAPVATQTMTMNANLPTGYHLGLNSSNAMVVLNSSNTEVQAPTSQVGVYDSQGTLHQLTLTWTPTATSATQTDPWALSITDTTNGGSNPVLGGQTATQAAKTAAATTGLVTAEANLTSASGTLTTASSTLTTATTTLTTAQSTLATDLGSGSSTTTALAAVPGLSAAVAAVTAARTTAASAAPTLNADMTTLAGLAASSPAASATTLQTAVQNIETARQAVTTKQAAVYQDELTGGANSGPTGPLTAALTAASTNLSTLVGNLTAAGGPADAADAANGFTGTPGSGPIATAAAAVVTDWGQIDTATTDTTNVNSVASKMTLLGNAVTTAAATNTTITGVVGTVVGEWTAVDTAANTVAADQTAVSFAQSGVTTAQAAVTAALAAVQTTHQAGAPLASFGADGTLVSLAYTDPTGKAVTIAANAANANPLAELTFNSPFNSTTSGKATIALNLGNIGETNGLTQFASSSYTLRSLSQDGVPPGSFSSISMETSGDIYANYDNGQTRLIAQVPLATFGNADALQSQNGSSYTVTNDSGNPSLQDAGSNGAGNLVTSSVESSNVDIASQLSKLIVAQQAYSANAKVVTTSDTLLQTTLDMKR